MDDTVATAWTTALPHLKRIELFGPFLVRAPAWHAFFKGHPNLEGFLITQSPRFDLECMRVLVETSSRTLRELRLDQIGKMNDAMLDLIKSLTSGSLRELSLAYPGNPFALSEGKVEEMLGVVGRTLTHLDLSGNKKLSDGFLYQGIKPHMKSLISLALADIPGLTNKGVAEFFNTWVQNPVVSRCEMEGDEGEVSRMVEDGNNAGCLAYVNMSRNADLEGDALVALLKHSGPSLENLNINGWKATSEDALRAIANHATNLKKLDVGWCREMHDGVVLDLMKECPQLKELNVWGCQRLTAKCPHKVRLISSERLFFFVFATSSLIGVSRRGASIYTEWKYRTLCDMVSYIVVCLRHWIAISLFWEGFTLSICFLQTSTTRPRLRNLCRHVVSCL